MIQIEWNEIEWPTRPDFDEPQWLEIIRIRNYFNREGRMCTEFILEGDGGFIVRKAFPLRPFHHMRNFLLRFMGLDCGDIIRLGGYSELVGMSFYAFIDKSEGSYALYPILHLQLLNQKSPQRVMTFISQIVHAEDSSFLFLCQGEQPAKP